MKKTKILMPALAIASVGAVATPIAAMTSCKSGTTTSVLTYDQALAWIKKNYGETSEFVAPAKAVSSWNMTGEITTRKTMTEYEGYKQYITNHLATFFDSLGQMTYATAKTTISTAAAGEQDLTFSAKTTEDFSVDNPGFTTSNFMAPLCTENLDDYLNTYFYSIDAKRSVSFIPNGKTLKVSGTLSSVTDGDGGCNVFALPDCVLTFTSGKLMSVEFNFKKYAEGEYIWLNYTTAKYSDYFHFTIDEGGKISFKYTYA